MSDLEEDIAVEVGNIGAGHAANALANLLGCPVDMSVPSAGLLEVQELEDEFRSKEDEIFYGIYVPVEEGLEGGVLLMVSR
ncbi:hypothetical protein AKJ52_01480 [candidate division MSBL1 archaeon SCGC-AAA382C18]|uniref:CheC-like protein domain-containing protein n=1 Tax=candidate division MSBL1 archaeon SCGC-AAA382C18 TaxID=1698281 RepID=A0A133VK78_9EURY|nr:hypothetical protein AKJ52_01480 [candidate division MSBL1 archaeon SCGC-AAA382C18]